MKKIYLILLASLMVTTTVAQRPGRRGDGPVRFGDGLRPQSFERIENRNLPPARWYVSVRSPRIELTEAHQTEWRNLREQFRSEDLTPQEFRDAQRNLFDRWGIDPRPSRIELTEEQRNTFRSLLVDLRQQQLNRDQVQAEIESLYDGWGIEAVVRLIPIRRRREDRNGSSDTNLRTGSNYAKEATKEIEALNSPNPFISETRITYTIPKAANVSVHIYNLIGQPVRTYEQGYQQAGSYSITWDGTTPSGSLAPSGVFIYQIQAGNKVFVNRMTMMK